jgi:cytochrome oxidase Cu insertion factor (SCO1/SenC/PrrC family)
LDFANRVMKEVGMLKLMTVCAGLGLAMAAASPGRAQPGATPQNPVDLKVGDVAPAFALQGSDGKIHKLSDYKGKTVVLAWFPKAFTGG